MAESEANPAPEDVHEEDTNAPGYKPPEFEPLENILKKDQEDESLNKYKQALLGGGDAQDPCRFMYILKCKETQEMMIQYLSLALH